MKNQKVAYKFNSKHLGKAFMEELVEMGYKNILGKNPHKGCHINLDLSDNKVNFADILEGYDKTFQLETQWKEALEFAKAELDKPEFKKGDWVKDTTDVVFRLQNLKDRGRAVGKLPNGNKYTEAKNYIKKATKDEIEQALIKEAERRDYEGKQIKLIRGVYKGELSGETMTGNYKYVKGKLIDYSPLAEYTLFDGENWAEAIETKRFFDWDVEENDDYYQIGCRMIDKQFLKDLRETLDDVTGYTVLEVIDELKKIDL